LVVRRIIDGTAYDTETAALIEKIWGQSDNGEAAALYQTRNGAFFLWIQYLTPGYNIAVEITPLTDEKAQKWLEDNANELVEQYFGKMPDGGAAERRFTLRIPNNLAKRLEAIAQSKEMPLNRYVNRCLERCAAEDGKPTNIV
jgi:predicted DNA binding CopG/RHH family protein